MSKTIIKKTLDSLDETLEIRFHDIQEINDLEYLKDSFEMLEGHYIDIKGCMNGIQKRIDVLEKNLKRN